MSDERGSGKNPAMKPEATHAPEGKPSPAAELRQITLGTMVAQALYAAAKLGVADQLKDGPKSCESLARAVGAHPGALYRLLRALASRGIFREAAGRSFALTPMAEMLRSDVPGSARAWAIFRGEPFVWNSWGAILHSLRTGDSAFGSVHGESGFEYFEHHPEAGKIFNAAMESVSGETARALLDAYDFSRFRVLADVGGGTGALLQAILREHPGIRGILADLPHVVAGSAGYLNSGGVGARCRVAPTDIFQSIPAGADAYLFKHIFHDWSDEDSARILRNCRQVVPEAGKLLVVETVIPPGNDFHPGKFVDLEMLVMTEGGRERTEQEFAELLRAGGFELEKIYPTAMASSIVEARPAP